ncbi:MAG: hypothetical protein FJ139_06235 [Deltaproteobacteria bacterium]|nr:hypothetical protein [Deltaproteobacteria bacterium]
MKGDKMMNRSYLFFFLIFLVLLTGCYAQIEGWSQESFRSSEFNTAALSREGMALLPVIILEDTHKKEEEPVGKIPDAPYTQPVPQAGKVEEGKRAVIHDAYRVILNEILLSRVRARYPHLQLVSPSDVLKRINDAGLTADYRKFNDDFPRIGFDGSLLKRFGKTLNSRYVFVSQAVLTESKSDTSLIVIWSFGRKSVLRSVKISGQIWDTTTGNQMWEGLGVGYNRLSSYEQPPLTEEIAREAVDSLLSNIHP